MHLSTPSGRACPAWPAASPGLRPNCSLPWQPPLTQQLRSPRRLSQLPSPFSNSPSAHLLPSSQRLPKHLLLPRPALRPRRLLPARHRHLDRCAGVCHELPAASHGLLQEFLLSRALRLPQRSRCRRLNQLPSRQPRRSPNRRRHQRLKRRRQPANQFPRRMRHRPRRIPVQMHRQFAADFRGPLVQKPGRQVHSWLHP